MEIGDADTIDSLPAVRHGRERHFKQMTAEVVER